MGKVEKYRALVLEVGFGCEDVMDAISDAAYELSAVEVKKAVEARGYYVTEDRWELRPQVMMEVTYWTQEPGCGEIGYPSRIPYTNRLDLVALYWVEEKKRRKLRADLQMKSFTVKYIPLDIVVEDMEEV